MLLDPVGEIVQRGPDARDVRTLLFSGVCGAAEPFDVDRKRQGLVVDGDRSRDICKLILRGIAKRKEMIGADQKRGVTR